jgi:hypothetical protein
VKPGAFKLRVNCIQLVQPHPGALPSAALLPSTTLAIAARHLPWVMPPPPPSAGEVDLPVEVRG